jgi:hypothetical protein
MRTSALFVFSILLALSSCKPVQYNGMQTSDVVRTEVVLTRANFRVLASVTGSASARKKVFGMGQRDGLLYRAKADLLANARSAGFPLTGSRALINFTTDIIESDNRIVLMLSAEIIEFFE